MVKRNLILVVAAMLAGLALVTTATAKEAAVETAPSAVKSPPPRRAIVSGCLAGKCHAELNKQEYTHTALVEKTCESCHQVVEANAKAARCKSGNLFTVSPDPDMCYACHKKIPEANRHAAVESGCLTCHGPHGGKSAYNLRETPVSLLCTKCHEEVWSAPWSREQRVASVHSPVSEGDCSGCHDPHGSPNKPLLKASKDELCFKCHIKEKLLGDTETGVVHFPVEAGQCRSCHRPHSSLHPHLLESEGRDICLSCHGADSKNPQASRLRIDIKAAVAHPPVQDGVCTDCHRAHSSKLAKLLTEPGQPALCYGCHSEFDAPHRHSAVKLGRCSSCHNVHGSANAKILVAPPGAELCFLCHSDDVTGRKSVHAPVAGGQCLGCHAPHAEKNSGLLVRGKGNATCLSCHGANGVAAAKIDLSKKVVHGAISRYGCKACHDPHGSNQETLVIDTINKVCISCHAKQATGDHIITGISGKPHPVEGFPDPAHDGKDLSCVSCHQPHAGDFPSLWYMGKSKTEMCNACHEGFGKVKQNGNAKRNGNGVSRRNGPGKNGSAGGLSKSNERKPKDKVSLIPHP